MRIAAFDPGKTTGLATFNEQHEVLTVGELSYPDELYQHLYDNHYDLYIVEDYKIRPDKFANHDWSAGETIRVIGALEFAAFCRGAELQFQQPSVKPMAYKHLNVEYKKSGKNVHLYDALAHGVFFLRKRSEGQV
jgi:hypothetical protein